MNDKSKRNRGLSKKADIYHKNSKGEEKHGH